MKPVVIHSEAKAELDLAIGFYEARKEGLGAELQCEVEDPIAKIQANPALGSPYKSTEIRFFLVHRFPFVVYYTDKPLLLLVVLKLAEQGQSFGDILALTPELAFRFCTYWSIVAHRRTQAPDVRYPFYHLKSDGFWSPLGEDGKPTPDRRLVRYASLPMDFVAFARDPACRDQAWRILIAKYFQPSERIVLRLP